MPEIETACNAELNILIRSIVLKCNAKITFDSLHII